jgi:hypothetical protein
MSAAEPAERHEGAIGALTDLGGKLVGALPPVFIMLVLLNVAFLGIVLWFLDSQLNQRTKLVNELVNRCLDIALHVPPGAG